MCNLNGVGLGCKACNGKQMWALRFVRLVWALNITLH